MSIFDNAPVGVLVYAQKGQKLLYANAYAKAFLLEDGNVLWLACPADWFGRQAGQTST